MAKVDIELLKMVMQRNDVDVRKIAEILEDINQEQAANADENEPEPAVKKQFVAVLSDSERILRGVMLGGWVVQIPENESPYMVTEKLIRAGEEFNTTKKGRRMPVQTIAEVCEHVPAKILKEQNVWVKTKEPVLIQVADNVFPALTSAKKSSKKYA